MTEFSGWGDISSSTGSSKDSKTRFTNDQRKDFGKKEGKFLNVLEPSFSDMKGRVWRRWKAEVQKAFELLRPDS